MNIITRLRKRFRKPATNLPVIHDWSHAYIVTDQGTYWRRGACGCQTQRAVEPVDDE